MLNDLKSFLKNIWEKEGFDKLTPIQERALPLIAEGRDVLAQSPTGSGKTLAYILPILQEVNIEEKQIQFMVLASSQELVMQLNEELQKWTANSGISSATLIGGANIKRQLEKLKKKPQIVLGTPGRVQELLKMKKLKVHQVRTVVLDEGDQLLVPEHLATVEGIIKSTPKERQLLLFSATLPKETEEVATKLMTEPEVIRVHDQELDKPEVEHVYVISEAREKIESLRKIVRNNDVKALVFFRDIGNLSVIAEKLKYKGIEAAEIHSDSKKQEREKAIKNFRSGSIQLLLATDVAARGLDITDLECVIHMDVPKEISQYVHRSGRTGRLGSVSGKVISIVEPNEEKAIKKISRELDIPLKRMKLVKGKMISDHRG